MATTIEQPTMGRIIHYVGAMGEGYPAIVRSSPESLVQGRRGVAELVDLDPAAAGAEGA